LTSPAQKAVGRRLHDLEIGDSRFAQPFDFLEPLNRRSDHLGERAEFFEELLCQRLHVAPRYGAKQDQLEHLVVVQRIVAGLHEPLSQAVAMAMIMRGVAGRRRGFRRSVAASHRTIICAACKDAGFARFCNGTEAR